MLGSAELDHGRLFACILLLSAGPLLVFAAKPLLAYVQATAAQLQRPRPVSPDHHPRRCRMISRSLPRPLLRVLPHPALSVLLLLVWLLLVGFPSPSATGCSAPSSACAFRC
ncbi:hypothetical protein ACPA9J_12280 [Pseudomonas aeruginosa]